MNERPSHYFEEACGIWDTYTAVIERLDAEVEASNRDRDARSFGLRAAADLVRRMRADA